jgi:hypothetical protein
MVNQRKFHGEYFGVVVKMMLAKLGLFLGADAGDLGAFKSLFSL